MKARAISLVLLFTGVILPSARAEMPPWAYQNMQKESPEALTIKVLSVKVSTTDEPTLKRFAITAEATVEAVRHSASGVRAGDTIRISYEVVEHKQPIAGPSEPDILEKGKSYPAFLSKKEKDGTFGPAAGGYSFRSIN